MNGITATETTTTTTGVNAMSNQSPSYYMATTATGSSDMDEANLNSSSSPNTNNGISTSAANQTSNSNGNIIIMADRFCSNEDNIDQVKLNKLLNCEIEYFKMNNNKSEHNHSVRSAGVSPKKASSEGLKLIDQLLSSSKAIDANNKRLSSVVTNEEALKLAATTKADDVTSANSKRAREVLSKSSIIHHLHTSLAPFTSLINDFDAQYSWDYTDNNNI